MQKSLNEMLNTKQQDFFFNDDKRINLLTGSVRSGKTYVSLLKFAIFVGNMPHFNGGVVFVSLRKLCVDVSDFFSVYG